MTQSSLFAHTVIAPDLHRVEPGPSMPRLAARLQAGRAPGHHYPEVSHAAV